ncbi:hypothetical protein CCAX7_007400 [Capsulimonas corticalis]|uniref:Uncharacterized protein n=1 Tax=Capsulimonas corticalis TaxID=2219043 RepID=A0A402D1S5_9BACT|nr:hypothetical protein [Capsulimonas corticalis]BDI28689.1 hypothetical protein CCAX7_007400 [Capsulimonas corticalis]
MKFRRVLTCGIASICLWIALPVAADRLDNSVPGQLGGVHGVYLGSGRILEASTARQMTVRGHLSEFQYSPTGEKIAYQSLVIDHGAKSTAIKFVDPWRSEPVEKTLAKSLAWGLNGERPRDQISMAGWSGDGRYLIVQRLAALDGADLPMYGDFANPARVDLTYECYDTLGDLASPKVVRMGVVRPGSVPTFAWSPDGARVLLEATIQNTDPADAAGGHPELIVYRPGDDMQQNIPFLTGHVILGWLDDRSLLFKKRPAARGEATQYVRSDLAGGASESVPMPDDWEAHPGLRLGAGFADAGALDPKSSLLTLDVIPETLPDSDRMDDVRAFAIWIRNRTEKKKYAAAPLGVTPGGDPPRPQWSPTGEAVAFLSHGDLFVTDLVKRDATAREKLDSGEQLSCEEENLIAASDLRQIGLGLAQYAQDYDGRMPPAPGVQDRVFPYLQDNSLFSLGDNQFVYRGNSQMIVADIKSPADLVIGEMDTRCAHHYVYADGHISSVSKP